MNDLNRCTARLQVAVDALIAEGHDSVLVMGALSQVAVKTAERNPSQTAMQLDMVAEILSTTAEATRGIQSVQALRDRLAR